MRRVSLFSRAALAAILLLPLAAAAQEAPARFIEVRGAGRARAAPDTAEVRVAVLARGREARAALADASEQMRTLLDRLRAAGLTGRDLRTTRADVTPEYERRERTSPDTGPLRIVGYRVVQELRVTVRDLERLGEILDLLAAAGGDRIQGLRFRIDDPEPLLDVARRRAVADARRRAELYAGEAGVTVGRLLALREEGASLPPPAPLRQMELAGRGAGVPVEPGEDEFRVGVVARFEIAE